MYDTTNSAIMRLYAVTPVHAGSGSSLGVVDLPIQRERHTNWPVINSSGVKGAMRAHFEKFKEKIYEEDKKKVKQFDKIAEMVFGSEVWPVDNSDKPESLPGALSVSDAKILAFPMRSSVAPFVWITCPAVLKRLEMDLELIGKKCDDSKQVESIEKDKAYWVLGEFKANENVLLEDAEVTCISQIAFVNLKEYFKDADRLLIVHDEIFKYAVDNCTSINAHIKIDQSRGTTEKGSLRYAEELPSDTIMYVVKFWGDTKNGINGIKAENIQKFIQEQVIDKHIQIGGDETLGRGIFKIDWIKGGI